MFPESTIIFRSRPKSVPRIVSSTRTRCKIDIGDDETFEDKKETIQLSLSKRIQQARLAKRMSQKELACAINEKPSVIMQYESGQVVPTNQILGKLEKALGIKLRGKIKY